MLLPNTTLIPVDKGVQKESSFYHANDFALAILIMASAFCLIMQFMVHSGRSKLPAANNAHFRSFQRKYFLVYFLALFGDWLQGPYIYKLYSHYGFTSVQIAVLYVVGFSASMIFGAGAGALADRFGRKKMCMVFCLTYSVCCFLKVFPNYFILIIGRLLGGISTSLLFSVFESWYIYEHTQKYDFPKEWIQVTFSRATFWNGVLAIVAGILAYLSADILDWGPVSPFLLAIPFLILSCVIMSKTWEENYVKRQRTAMDIYVEGLKIIFSSRVILYLGLVQSLFESVMYVFVFLWTPILDPWHPPLGIIFSIFMICIMIGSSSYQVLLIKKAPPYFTLMTALMCSFVSQVCLVCSTWTGVTDLPLAYSSFFMLEVSVGIYFPAIGYLKSECIPESQRASIMNWFRVPLNIITCVLLLVLHGEGNNNGNCVIFMICSLLMFVALVLVCKIASLLPVSRSDVEY